jgi:hypothetical protein
VVRVTLEPPADIEEIIAGSCDPDLDYALVRLGSARITERSKELTDSEDRKTEATSGSSTIATTLPLI